MARSSGTEPDDQQRQGNADADGAANNRRRGCKQILSVTQLTPGHAVTPRAPTGIARRPGMNDVKRLGSGSVRNVVGIANQCPNQSGQAERVWLTKG